MADGRKVEAIEVPTQVQEQPKPELIHGMDKAEFEALDYPAQMRVKMRDTNSDLRNQITREHTADFQILSATNAHIIAAMTGYTIPELEERAKKLGITLKGSLAGDTKPTALPQLP